MSGKLLRVLPILAAALFVCSNISAPAVSVREGNAPYHIHLSWTGDPATTVTVMWRTEGRADSVVKYGKGENLELSETGTSFSPDWSSGYVHSVTLKGLEPDTDYVYVCGSPAGWGHEAFFRTAPALPETFSFLIAGDSRNAGYSDPSLEDWETVVREMREDMAAKKGGYGFVQFLGDNIYDGSQNRVWNDWLDVLGIFSDSIPFMEAVGNHEYVYGTSTPHAQYLDLFEFPGNELWYSFNYSTAHVISLATDHPFGRGTPQYEWLEDDLEKASIDEDRPWVLIMLHRPPFTSVGGPDEEVRRHLSPLFDRYGVDLVFAGHKHIYERFFPLYGNGTVADRNTTRYRDPDAPIYVVDGCAGAPQYPGEPGDRTVYMENELGYTRVTIRKNGTMRVEHVSIRVGGPVVADEFFIRKEVKYSDGEKGEGEGEVESSFPYGLVFGAALLVLIVVLAILWVLRRRGKG